jgi:hypothetical protein
VEYMEVTNDELDDISNEEAKVGVDDLLFCGLFLSYDAMISGNDVMLSPLSDRVLSAVCLGSPGQVPL